MALCWQPTMQPPQWMQPRRAGPAPPKYGSGTSTPSAPGAPKKVPTGVGRKLSPRPRPSAISRRTASAGVIARIGRHAQHPAGGGVMTLPLALPMGQLAPGRLLERRGVRLQQDVGIAQAPAADPGAMQDEDVPERTDLEDAEAAEPGRP